MSAIYSVKIHLPVLFSILMVLISCSSSVAKKNPGPQSETQINFSSPLSVYLYNHHVSETQSDFDLVNERENLLWKGNASLI